MSWFAAAYTLIGMITSIVSIRHVITCEDCREAPWEWKVFNVIFAGLIWPLILGTSGIRRSK